MLADIIRLRRGDMEATAERVAFEQQEWAISRHYQEALHQEFAEASEALRSELTVQATQAVDYYVQEGNAYYRAHVRSLEHQMEARIAHDRSTLQQEFLHQTAEVQVRAAAAETAHAQLWEEHRLYTNEATAYQQHEQGELRRELRDAAEQYGLEVATVNSLRQVLERERALRETNLRHQAEEWRRHSEAITESATEEINYQRQELSAERLETNDLQQYLQDMLVELEDKNEIVEDWEEWYWNNYGQEGDGPEEREEVQQQQPPLLQSQQAPRDQVPTTPCPAPATPPVLHGVVPSSLYPRLCYQTWLEQGSRTIHHLK